MRDSRKNRTLLRVASYLLFLFTIGLFFGLSLFVSITWFPKIQSFNTADYTLQTKLPHRQLNGSQKPTIGTLSYTNGQLKSYSAALVQRLHAPSQLISGTLILTKTVGTSPSTCSDTTEIYALSGTDVYFCYTVENQTDTIFDSHILTDNSLPQQTISYTYVLTQGGITTTILGPVNITKSIAGTQGNATWTASGQDETIVATTTAEVNLTQPGLSVSALLVPKVIGTANNECGAPAVPTLAVPLGMNVQHCLTIKNNGDRPLSSIKINAPELGLNEITIPNRQISPGGEYRLTPIEINSLGVPAATIIPGFTQDGVTEAQETVFTATGQTPESVIVSDTATSTLTITNDSINADVEVKAGTRQGECDDTAIRVSSNTNVYFCVVVTNRGSLDLSNLRAQYTQPQGGSETIPNLPASDNYMFMADTPVRVISLLTDTVTLTGQVITQWGIMDISKIVERGVGIVPTVNETITPLPTLTHTPVTAGPTATNTRRPPLSTPTLFPTYTPTPTPTRTPTVTPVPPTDTPVISPLDTPTPTPTTAILRSVVSPTPVPSVTPTQTLVPTPTPTPTPTPDVSTPTLPPLTASQDPVDQATPAQAEVDDSANTQVSPAPTEDQTAAAQKQQVAANSTPLTPTLQVAEQVSPLVEPTNTPVPAQVTTPTAVEVPNLPTGTLSPAESDIITDTTLIGDVDKGATGISETNTGDAPSANQISTGSVSNGQPDTSLATGDSGSQVIVVSQERPTNSLAPPSSSLLLAARIIDSALAAAAWIWFLCGSFVFFGVAGLIAGLYFRRQERNRFALVNQAELFGPAEADGGVDAERSVGRRVVTPPAPARQTTNAASSASAIYGRPAEETANRRIDDVEIVDSVTQGPQAETVLTRPATPAPTDIYAPTGSKPPITQETRQKIDEVDDDDHWPASLP